MPQVTIVYWRDIPAQVIAGKGRGAAKVALDVRFEQAIDRAAMKAGLSGSDDYLAQWRRGDPYAMDGAEAEIAAREAARIEQEYDAQALRALIEAGGRSA